MAKLFYSNKFILTKKLHGQYFRCCFKETQKKLRLISLVLTFVFLILSVAALIFTGSRVLTSVLMVLTLYFLFMVFFGYSFRQWVDFRRLKDEHGDVIVMLVDFYSDNIKVKVNKTDFSFKYSTIDRAYVTEDEYILILKAPGMPEHGQVLFRTAFKDKEEEFRNFINSKTGKNIFREVESIGQH